MSVRRLFHDIFRHGIPVQLPDHRVIVRSRAAEGVPPATGNPFCGRIPLKHDSRHSPSPPPLCICSGSSGFSPGPFPGEVLQHAAIRTQHAIRTSFLFIVHRISRHKPISSERFYNILKTFHTRCKCKEKYFMRYYRGFFVILPD